ncbi:MAG: hypothetical protein CSYNP_04067 [Syntrophus sp. SKADARSKE-3]|nr:hypothetical protein [Syntrophus sp. SKADARSKE-3]
MHSMKKARNRHSFDARLISAGILHTILLLILVTFPISNTWAGSDAGIPAAPVLTLYQFNGPLEIPYYNIDTFDKPRSSSPAGYLTQGSSVIPCVVVRHNRPLTDRDGAPYVGFQIVMDARDASPDSVATLRTTFQERLSMKVSNHHCDSSVKYVVDLRKLYPNEDVPFFDPPISKKITTRDAYVVRGNTDRIVRAFHNSSYCGIVNHRLIGRRFAMEEAWKQFIQVNKGLYSLNELENAKHTDYVMRTALFEGDLNRGCNSYGGCERNIIALTIRNRAMNHCSKKQGCTKRGDYKGVATKVSQYNIWDEYLTQITGITSCYLKDELLNISNNTYYLRLQRMYEQSLPDMQNILFGDDADLQKIFSGSSLKDLIMLRHYYHAPAMDKCFPDHSRVVYITGAIAKKNNEYALIANKWIQIGQKVGNGYYFQDLVLQITEDKDKYEIKDTFQGYIMDGRKVSFKTPSRCVPYGIPNGCTFKDIGRYRRLPSWHASGKNIELMCQIKDMGEYCQNSPKLKSVKVGSPCDTQMRLITGVK